MTIGEYVTCKFCGHEHRIPEMFLEDGGSAFGVSLNSCICGKPVPIPMFIEGRNTERLVAAQREPLLRDYGDDGSVFMGGDFIAYQLTNEALARVHSVYSRNRQRVLDLFDLYQVVELSKRRCLIDSSCVMIATAYEVLTDDLFALLREAEVSRLSGAKIGQTVGERRMLLLEALKLADHPEWEPHIRSLRYMLEFRHCLAHQAGICDQKLLNQTNKLGDATMVQVGEPLNLPFSATISFLDSLQRMAPEFLERADKLVG